MDSPNDVTSGPSCTTAVSPSSPKNGAVPTPDSPPSGPCVQTPPELPPSIPQLSHATAMGDFADGVSSTGLCPWSF